MQRQGVVSGVKSRVDPDDGCKAAREQPGANEQRQHERNLRDDERVARSRLTGPAGVRPAVFSSRGGEIRTPRLHRRQQARDHSCRQQHRD
jgi:hypothetical protein